METVTVKGKVYQIGQLYFSGCGCHTGTLMEVRNEEYFVLDCGNYIDVDVIVGIDVDQLGMITDAPIELEDGEWYMCDLESGPAVLMFKDADWFYSDGRGFDVPQVSVIPLHKMVKA